MATELALPGKGDKELLPARIETCGMPLGKEVILSLQMINGAGFAREHMIQSCGSTHFCAVCQDRKLVQRAEVLRGHLTGKAATLVTLTIPHQRSHNLYETLCVLKTAWAKFRRGTKELCGGEMSYVRRLEVTYGKNGWHPHFHVLVMSDLPSKKELVDLWGDSVVSVGWDRPSARHGCDVKKVTNAVDASTYVCKDLAYEISGTKSQSLTFMEMLDEDNVDTYWNQQNEYIAVMSGERLHTTSRDMSFVRMADDEPLQPTAAGDVVEFDAVAIRSDDYWRRERAGVMADLLVDIEMYGFDAACEKHSLSFRRLTQSEFDTAVSSTPEIYVQGTYEVLELPVRRLRRLNGGGGICRSEALRRLRPSPEHRVSEPERFDQADLDLADARLKPEPPRRYCL